MTRSSNSTTLNKMSTCILKTGSRPFSLELGPHEINNSMRPDTWNRVLLVSASDASQETDLCVPLALERKHSMSGSQLWAALPLPKGLPGARVLTCLCRLKGVQELGDGPP